MSDQLVQKRATLKTRVTKFRNLINKSDKNSSIDIINVRERLAAISDVYNSYDQVQNEIELLDASQENDRDEFEDNYFLARAEAKLFLEGHPSEQVNNVKCCENNIPISNEISAQTKLPPLSLPTFDGNRENWLSFYETFMSLIHNESKITNIQKLYYLKSCITGEAAKIIKTLSITADNYEIALELLVRRYDNKALLIKEHVTALFNLNEIKKPTSLSLREIIDKTNVHIKILKNLSLPTDQWDVLLIHLILSKLDFMSKKEWEHHNQRDIPTFTEFCEFLYKRSRTLESLEVERKPLQYNNSKLQTVNVSTSEIKTKCANCNGTHFTSTCETLIALSVNDRFKRIVELKLCKNCLKGNHPTISCKSTNRCKTCKRPHHSLIHFNEDATRARAPENVTEQPSINNFCRNDHLYSQVLLSTALVETKDKNNEVRLVRLLLDAGSQSNFICYSTCRDLNLNLKSINYPILGINESGTNVKHCTKIKIKSRYNNYEREINCLLLTKITRNLPLQSFQLQNLEIPKNIKLADDKFNISSPIDILVGADFFWEIMQVGQIKVHKNQPYFQKTLLGWIVGGNIGPRELASNLTVTNLATPVNNEIDLQLAKFWEIEQCEEGTRYLNTEQIACEKHFETNVKRAPSGRYIVSLPFKSNLNTLGDSKGTALKRLFSLERRFNKDTGLRNDYVAFMKEYLDLNHMELIPDNRANSKNCFYLPHHAVYKSSTKKIRVVFDGSAKSSNGLSLNDTLIVGPTIQNDLFSILIRFRTHKIALSADVAKMFRQVLINKDHRDFQRILWRQNVNEPVREYRLKTVTYGTASAPYLAIKTLHQLAKDEGPNFKLAPNVVINDFYVDDLLTGADNVTNAKKLREELISMLNKGGFELRQWSSNVQDVSTPSLVNDSNSVNLYKQEAKVLGINWDCKSDIFKYSLNNLPIPTRKVTKRCILSTTSSLFDPLGLIGPIIISAKVLLQRLWSIKIGWDESVPIHIQTSWEEFTKQLSEIKQIRIPRNINPNSAISLELHGFADASQNSYGACIYLRSVDTEGIYNSRLICAKSKVAPLKTITIPRLELCAALLLTILMQRTHENLKMDIKRIYYWTDSSIVLSWLANTPNNWKPFVANRVAKIQLHSNFNQWYHIDTKQNPADIISRGTTVNALINSKLWWEGPEFLKTQNLTLSKCNVKEDVAEKRGAIVVALQTAKENDTLLSLQKYSCFNKLIRIVSYIYRFVHNTTNKSLKRTGNLTISEIEKSKVTILKIAQQAFNREVQLLNSNKTLDRNSNLLSLNPFMDKDGLLRVGGRLRHSSMISYQQKHPIILPSQSHITEKLILDEHKRLLHSGPLLTLSSLRERYWPIGGRNLVKKLLHNCIKCFRSSPKSCAELMGDLPKVRIEPARPFLNSGIDYAGPILIKESRGRGKRSIKAYIVVFVCFATRAIHLELALDLTADGFINALKRFISRRGHIKNIYSDNATNFKGANNEILKLNKLFKAQNKISNELLHLNIKWNFIPPQSPNFGGLWEAAVKSCKTNLKRIIGNSCLTYDEMYTLLVRIEACLNSRPLTPISSDPNDLNPLTPGHFLIGDSLTSFVEPDVTKLKLSTLSRWQYVERLRQMFWRRWTKEYLSQIQVRSKWKTKAKNSIKINDLVLLKEDNVPPLQWSLGRIIALHPGTDNLIRTVSVKTTAGIKKRGISKICVLPIDN